MLRLQMILVFFLNAFIIRDKVIAIPWDLLPYPSQDTYRDSKNNRYGLIPAEALYFHYCIGVFPLPIGKLLYSFPMEKSIWEVRKDTESGGVILNFYSPTLRFTIYPKDLIELRKSNLGEYPVGNYQKYQVFHIIPITIADPPIQKLVDSTSMPAYQREDNQITEKRRKVESSE